MELDLSRVEYLQAGLTSGRTLRLLPGPGLGLQMQCIQLRFRRFFFQRVLVLGL